MTSTVHRRSFIAAATLAVPAVALSAMPASARMPAAVMEFDDLMKQAGGNFKDLRSPMRSLTEAYEWESASYNANQLTILFAQCIIVADQVHIPDHAKAKYEDNEADFIRDLRISLADAAGISANLSKALLSEDRDAANDEYRKLRSIKGFGHDSFGED
jgi:predicted nucleic-acid-binding protein